MFKRVPLLLSNRASCFILMALVCLQPLSAQNKPAATLLEMAGQVSILQGPGQYKALFQGDKVLAQEEIVTGHDSYAKFRLADNSTFEVFENSHVQFRDTWPSFGDLLNVLIGRVKVFIDHSKGPNHNSVTTPTAVISVRGTVFDVSVEDSDGTTLVTVDEGAVRVHARTTYGDRDLGPGDAVRVFRNQPLIGQKVDHGLIQKAMNALDDLARQVMLGRAGGVGGPVGGTGGGATTGSQGDKGKQTGTSTGAPAPPPVPAKGGGNL